MESESFQVKENVVSEEDLHLISSYFSAHPQEARDLVERINKERQSDSVESGSKVTEPTERVDSEKNNEEILPSELKDVDTLKTFIKERQGEGDIDIRHLVEKIRQFVEACKKTKIDGKYEFADVGVEGSPTKNDRELAKIIGDMSENLYSELYKKYSTQSREDSSKIFDIDVEFRETCRFYLKESGIKNLEINIALVGERFDVDTMSQVGREENRTTVKKALSWVVKYSGRTISHAKVLTA